MQKATLLKKDSKNDFDRIQFGDKTYFLEEVIGQTNASKVYRGFEEETPEQKLALKIVLLNPDADLDELGTYSSLEERVDTYRNINHTNIAGLCDFFYWDNGVTQMPVVVRAYIPGESLQEQIGNGQMHSPNEAMVIFKKLLEISDYLETSSTREIVVRDIKPGNIIIDGEGKPHLTDLELCTSSGQTTTGGRGTISYMPPEQLFDSQPTSKWDRYAIAKTMEHLLTGRLPEHGVPVNLPQGINIPHHVKEMLRRMTARNPEERYNSTQEILLELNGNRVLHNNMSIPSAGDGTGERSLVPLNKQLALIARYCGTVVLEEDFSGAKEKMADFIDYLKQTAHSIYNGLDKGKFSKFAAELPDLYDQLKEDSVKVMREMMEPSFEYEMEKLVQEEGEEEVAKKIKEKTEKPVGDWLLVFGQNLQEAGLSECEQEFHDQVEEYCTANGFQIHGTENDGNEFRLATILSIFEARMR